MTPIDASPAPEWLARYRRLFVHRDDVFAQQFPDRSYLPVGSGHWEGVAEARKYRYDSYTELTDDHLREHLDGSKSYGVYVVRPMSGKRSLATAEPYPDDVRYLVFDLDTYDTQALDFLIRQVQQMVGSHLRTEHGWDYRCLILEDSGGKGYHIWLLLAEPMSAAKARAWADPIRQSYATMRRSTAPDWPPLEIFPKQDSVPDGGYGNLVKLPFGVHAASHARAFLVPVPGWANCLEDVRPYDPAEVPERPPEPVKPAGAAQGSSSAPFPCVARILEEGVGSGQRDNAMYHLARYARGCGIPDDLVEDWCQRTNTELFSPPMDPSEVTTKVASALAATNANPGCRAEWLDGFCPGGERCHAPWNSRKREADEYPVNGTSEERRAWRDRHGGA